MKSLSICVLIGVLAGPALLQTTKSKSKATSAKPKTSSTPTKKPVAAKPKPTPKKPDDKAEWEKVIATADRTERIAALEKFIAAFPKSTHLSEAAGLLAAAHVEAGNDALAAGDLDSAVSHFKAGLDAVPVPVVQGFWDGGLIKIPANLYFRDRRDVAIEMAKTLEEKAKENEAQLLSIARFYLTVEGGSEAARIAQKAITAAPTSAAAYRTLGLAQRMQFRIEDSAAAFAKALELEPESIEARRGLAEMKRALGRPDEAVALYDEVLAKEPDNIAARTGRISSLFEAGKRSDAEAELAKALEAVPNNVMLLGGVAYWYAAHRDGDKAVEFAQKAITQDPRFIWSHIALARGLLLQNKMAEAERALIVARRYGNFPTLEYELASARSAAGYYREAGEGLVEAFRAKNGAISTDLGGRVSRESKSLTELIADERRASIFAPTAADDVENSEHLAALLEFQQQLDAAEPNEAAITAAADSFAKGDDAMLVHRQLYAASRLLEKKIGLAKVVDLAKAAVPNVDRGLAAPSSSTAVMANELYDPRAIAATRSEYVNVPEVPRATLSAIVRGRIEDLIGWAAYQSGSVDEAVVHLRRAIGVLPADSAWWRATTWHLGAGLALSGKDAEALEMYMKSYKNGGPDPIRYSVIESLYRKVNGTTDGLVTKIGENPSPAIAANITPTPEAVQTPTPDNSAIPIATPSSTPALEATPEPSPSRDESPRPRPTPEEEPTATPEPSPTPTLSNEPRPVPSPSPPVDATAAPEVAPCEITVSEDTITLSVGGGDLAIIVGRADDGDLDGLEATSSSAADVTVRREQIAGVRARALFVLRPVSDKRGVYQVNFALPCGKKVLTVNLRPR